MLCRNGEKYILCDLILSSEIVTFLIYTFFLRNKCERRVKFDAELVSINTFPPFVFFKLNMYEIRSVRVYNQFPF